MDNKRLRIRVEIGDDYVDTSVPQVAHAFIDQHAHLFSAGRAPARALSRPPTNVDAEAFRNAWVLLDTIHKAGPNGAKSGSVSSALHVAGRGIGNKLKPVKALLEAMGFDPKEVYARVKVPKVGNFWRPRSAFNAAYEAVKQQAGSG